RARTHASAMPGGSMTTVAASAAAAVKSAIWTISVCTGESGCFEDPHGLTLSKPCKETRGRLTIAAAADDGCGIDNARTVGSGNGQRQHGAVCGHDIR